MPRSADELRRGAAPVGADRGGTQGETSVWHIGGEDVHLRIPLLLALRRRGFDVAAAGSDGAEHFERSDVPFHRYSLRRSIHPMADRRSVRELERLFRRHRPDIVHAFDTKPGILAMLAASRSGIASRLRTITGMGYVFSSRSPGARVLRPAYRHLQRRASRSASVTVFQNEDDRAYFLRRDMVSADREALVPGSGIDLEVFDAASCSRGREDLRAELGAQSEPIVTMVSRLVRTKGVLEFLEAARVLSRGPLPVRFVLVGPLHDGRSQRVDRARIEGCDAVQWLGPRSDVPSILAASDLFVLPSYYREGVPRSLLEAAASRLPLVTTDMPGCRDVVRDGWNGRVVPPRDVAALTEAVDHLLRRRDEWGTMGDRSRTLVEETFSLDAVTHAYADLYERAARGVLS